MVDRIKLFSYVTNKGKPDWGIGRVMGVDEQGILTVAFVQARFIKRFKSASFFDKVNPYHLFEKGKIKEKTMCGLKDKKFVSCVSELKQGEFICPICQCNTTRSDAPGLPDIMKKRDPTLKELTWKDIEKLMRGPKRLPLSQKISIRYSYSFSGPLRKM